MDNMENESTNGNNMLLQSTTQTGEEASTNVAAAANLGTDLGQQETYSQVSQQAETTYGTQDHSGYMPDLIRAKQTNDGQVPEAVQHFAATKVSNCDLDSNLEKVIDSVSKQDKKTEIGCNKHGKHTSFAIVNTKEPSEAVECSSMSTPTIATIHHEQSHDTTTMLTLRAQSRPPRPPVLPASADDSVRRYYVLSKLQATASRLIANSAVDSLSRQSNVVNNAGFAQPEHLMVAVPVEEDEVHVYAVSYDASQRDVYKQVQRVRARRYSCCLYFAVFLVLAAAVMIASIVSIKENKSNEQEQETGTETEMTLLQNMTQLIVSIMGADAALLDDTSSPYAKALTWLLQSNERNKSQEMTSTLAQRFYAASFYFDTTTDDDKWTDCNPPNSTSEFDQTCYNLYSNTTAQAWLSDSHECEWLGVRCDNHQQIIRLDLEDMNLVGTIPSSVAKFPFLQWLWLTSSQLEGNMSLLSDSHHLICINFDDNVLSGDLSSVWQIHKLVGFYIDSNHITGSVSSQVGNSVDLKLLSLYNNELTGIIPSEVGKLNSIFYVDISNNHFRGELPQSMQFWSMIKNFYASENSFSGSIPTFFGQFSKTLWDTELYDNNFTGTLPDELFYLSGLHWLDVSDNELSGTLDARFAQLTSLQRNDTIIGLVLNNNHFSGTIPTELGLLTGLVAIYLQGNNFTGTVPSSLCRNNFDSYFTLAADCGKNDNGQATLQCDCCTECCQADGIQCVSN